MALKKYTRHAVLCASILLLLLNVVFSYLYSMPGPLRDAANKAVNDVASMNISFTLLNMIILSSAAAVVLFAKAIYDFVKKKTSLSFYNWAAVGLLICFVVSIGNFVNCFRLG